MSPKSLTGSASSVKIRVHTCAVSFRKEPEFTKPLSIFRIEWRISLRHYLSRPLFYVHTEGRQVRNLDRPYFWVRLLLVAVWMRPWLKSCKSVGPKVPVCKRNLLTQIRVKWVRSLAEIATAILEVSSKVFFKCLFGTDDTSIRLDPTSLFFNPNSNQ